MGSRSRKCFNPCFDGSVARGRGRSSRLRARRSGFNPCFDGSVARGAGVDEAVRDTYSVSILVLMEV